MAATAFTPVWGSTLISGGGTLNFTRGANIGSSGALITLNGGTLRVGADNTATYSYNNPIAVGAGGAKLAAQFTTGLTAFNFSGAVSGAGSLTLETVGAAQNYRGSPGLRFSGNNTGFTGAAEIRSAATLPGEFGAGVARFAGASSFFPNASSVMVRDGGILAFEYAVTPSALSAVTVGRRGGIGAAGAGGSLASLSSPMDYVGIGGVLLLDNRSALNNDRIGNTAAVALDNNRFHIIGRAAADSVTSEVIGALTFAHSSLLSFDRLNATNSGVKLMAKALGNASAGHTLLINQPATGTSASANTLNVADVKPAMTYGIITPGIQLYAGGNNVGNFARFDAANNLLSAVYNSTNINTAGPTNVVNRTTAQTVTANRSLYALRLTGALTFSTNATTVTIGSGGLILGATSIGSPTTRGALNFGAAPAFIGVYHPAADANIHAVIGGSGGVTFLGTTRNVNLTANNTFTGGLFINGGTVNLASVGAANQNDVRVNAFGRLTTNQSVGSGAVIGGLSGEGRVSAYYADSGSSELVISPSSGAHTFNGTLQNGEGGRTLGIVKNGAGMQVFGMDVRALYGGATKVQAGTLLIHGDFSAATGPVTVSAGATLGGIGVIGGPASTSAPTAVIAPGGSPGALTFNSSLNLNSGATLKFELGSAAVPGVSYDLLKVGGALTGSANGGDLRFEFSALPGFQTGVPYEILNFASASGLDYSDLAATVLPSGAALDANYGTGGWNITGNAVLVQFIADYIPEPATVFLLLGGGGLLALGRRRAGRN